MKLLFTSILALGSVLLHGQVFPYNLTVLNEPYSDLENSTVISSYTWDDPDFAIPLGFTFSALGSSASTLYISPFGFGAMIGFTDNFQQNPQDLLVIYGSDLIDIGYNEDQVLSPISVKTEGDPGSRIAKIEWKNCGFYNEVAEVQTSGNRINLQLWIYEGSNDLEIRFGMQTIKQPELVHEFGAPWLGFIDDLNAMTNGVTAAWFLSGNTGSPDITTITDLNSVLQPPILSADPQAGLVYRFSSSVVSVPAEAEDPAQWVIAGNPVLDHLLLIHPDFSDSWQFDVLDMSGRIVHRETLNSSRQSIDCGHLTQGVYFARFFKGDEIQTLRFVKN